jgi:low-density lipoprotein receptor-related protein 1 (alpha-2-macroglobulin receptor)
LCLPTSQTKHVCKCALGYSHDEKDQTKCKSVETVLIYSDSSGMKGVNPRSEQSEDELVPIPLVSYATDIDIHEATEHLYWLDNEKGKISRIKRDGTGKETVLKDLEGVNGLAIDWIAGNMYWGNPKDGFIEVAHLNGSSHYVLITEDLEKPMSLAVDPGRGYLFWTDVQKSRIERSTLDGTNRVKLITNERAADLAIDIDNQKIYWCDAAYDKMESMNYDGSDRKTVYTGTPDLSHLHSPIVNKGFLYWIDMGHTGGSIMAAPVSDFKKPLLIRKDVGVTIKDLTIFSRGRQTGKNPCGVKNGGCDDLCFWNGTHPVCICAHGKIGSDGKSCEPYDAFIAFSKVNSIETAHVGRNVTPNYPYPAIQSAEHIRNAIGLAFDYQRNTLFYSDVQLGTVNSVLFNGSNFGVVAEKQGSVEGLYFEASHSDLYWTCSNDASINRVNPYDQSAKVEKIVKLTSNDKPRGISVDPCDSRVYWTNWDSNRPSIQRAYLSGYQIESIIVTDIRMPNSLALDHAARKLYWVDARLDKIERAELDGTNRKIIARDKPKHAFSLAVYKDFIIWSDWVQLSIMRANKYTGEDVKVLRKDIPKPMAIVAVASQEEVCTSNPCKILNGGCTDLCVLDEHAKVQCRCSPGKVLLSDGRCTIDTTARMNCTSDQFACENGGCIWYPLSCDGMMFLFKFMNNGLSIKDLNLDLSLFIYSL